MTSAFGCVKYNVPEFLHAPFEACCTIESCAAMKTAQRALQVGKHNATGQATHDEPN